MINIILIVNYMITISFIVLLLYLLLYGILLLIDKIKNIKIINSKWQKVRYSLTALPFVLLGIYMILMAFVFQRTLDRIVLIILGLFLIFYAIYKCYNKIKDVDFFKGLDENK